MQEKRIMAHAEPQRPLGSLSVLHDTPFAIERQSVTTPATMKNHHYHNNYELYYLYSGDRYYFIKDRTYHVKRGNLVLVKPYEIHCTSNYSKSGYDRCLIMFKRSFVAEVEALMPGINLFECCDRDIHIIPLDIQEQSFVEGLLFSMTNEFKAKDVGYEAFLKTAMTQILLIVSRHASQVKEDYASGLGATHKTVSEVAAYINNNYNEDITLSGISERFFISPCYFSRIFKRVTGISFNEYLNGVRVKEAQRLLASTDESVAAIGEAVGYKSSTHFGRSFMCIAGMSPSEYRRIKRGPRA